MRHWMVAGVVVLLASFAWGDGPAATQPGLGCATQPSEAFIVRIGDFRGAAGYTLTYQLTPDDQIVVMGSTDWGKDHSFKEVYRARLTEAQRRDVHEFLDDLPLERLDDSYVDPNVMDGEERKFEFRLPGRRPKTIAIENVKQRDMLALAHKMDKLVPPKFRMYTSD